jgi:hypothetical protein
MDKMCGWCGHPPDFHHEAKGDRWCCGLIRDDGTLMINKRCGCPGYMISLIDSLPPEDRKEILDAAAQALADAIDAEIMKMYIPKHTPLIQDV